MSREIKFELIWGNGKPNKIVTLDEINLMDDEFMFVAYKRQYTGLKDVNGKEIYEGDIISIDKDSISEVTFYNGQFIPVGFPGIYSFLSEAAKIAKVIGNIYETPELLK